MHLQNRLSFYTRADMLGGSLAPGRRNLCFS